MCLPFNDDHHHIYIYNLVDASYAFSQKMNVPIDITGSKAFILAVALIK